MSSKITGEEAADVPGDDRDALALMAEIRDLLAAQAAQLLGRDEVARMLSVSPRKVGELAAEPGRMPPAVRIGTRVLWRRSDLLKWIDKGCERWR